MWQRRLFFSVVFILGTLIAVYGWIAGIREVHRATIIAVAGHALQVIGLFGNMLTPDGIEGEAQDSDDAEPLP